MAPYSAEGRYTEDEGGKTLVISQQQLTYTFVPGELNFNDVFEEVLVIFLFSQITPNAMKLCINFSLQTVVSKVGLFGTVGEGVPVTR